MNYIIISSISLSILYVIYRVIYKRESNFKQLRFYLLVSVLISTLLPLNNFSIKFPEKKSKIQTKQKLVQQNNGIVLGVKNISEKANSDSNFLHTIVDWLLIIKRIYLAITLVFVLRIIIQLSVLLIKYINSEKIKDSKYILLYNSGFRNSFSFFNWIFINNSDKTERQLQSILIHEKIHASQLHSIDLLIVEFIVAIMWFNPFAWMLKRSMQLVHEYLADDGVLNSGIEKFSYQEALINMVAEEKLIHITSSFNQSLIKNRIIMMNNEKITKKIKLKALVLIPISIILFLGIACVNGQSNETEIEAKADIIVDSQKPKKNESSDVVTAVAPAKMNVLYVGIDNPVNVAVSGYESSELNVCITNARIKGENGSYIVNPKRPGNSIISVWAGGEVVDQVNFRVKQLPNPIVYVAGRNGGKISKEHLLEEDKVNVMMPNFDFDLEFKVLSFDVTMNDEDGYFIITKANSNKITDEQKNLIKNGHVGSRINFEEVKVVGPDGVARTLQPIVFEIVE